MTLDEALEKVVLGFRARHDGMQPESFIYYEFNGFRIQFVHDGKFGSSSGWWAEEHDKEADWYVTETAVSATAWPELAQVVWDIDAALNEAEEAPISINKSGWDIFK
jgi:hypothetical protein